MMNWQGRMKHEADCLANDDAYESHCPECQHEGRSTCCGENCPLSDCTCTCGRDGAVAAIEAGISLLIEARKFVEDDVMMMADLTRFAPLDPESQAVHDSTTSLSELLLPRINAALDRLDALGKDGGA